MNILERQQQTGDGSQPSGLKESQSMKNPGQQIFEDNGILTLQEFQNLN